MMELMIELMMELMIELMMELMIEFDKLREVIISMRNTTKS
jgi:hypothetical protein